jgi:predicted nucleic acid-binding protein
VALVIDTGVLYATLDTRDTHHAACTKLLAEAREPKLATLDHRHFSVMRPRHVDALELLPA